MTRNILVSLMSVGLLLLLASAPLADVPTLINHQGFLTKGSSSVYGTYWGDRSDGQHYYRQGIVVASTGDSYLTGVTNPYDISVAPDTHTSDTCVPPPDSMVAWWPLDETSGPTAFDFAGIHQDNGTHINIPTPTPGKVSGALCFNGINEYVEVADHSEINFGTGDFSIDGWIRTTDASGVDVILDKRVASPNIQGYHLGVFNGNLSLQIADGILVGGQTYTIYNSTAFVATGNWEHFAVTVDRDNPAGIVFYLNCAQVGVAQNPTGRQGSLTNISPLTIAVRSIALGGGGYFNGCLDELELFNRVLTQPEIQTICNADSRGKCKPRNHYKTWGLFEPLSFSGEVRVQDQLMDDSLNLSWIEALSNPAKKVVQNDTFNIIGDTTDHLTWYRAQGRDTLLQVLYKNQFESTAVAIDSVKYLLLPTTKLPHNPHHDLDHYKAYKIRNPKSLIRQVQLEDQFDAISEDIDTLKPVYFLTPARKNNEPVYDAITHYVAYEIFPKRFASQTRQTTDQFGPHEITSLRSQLLLVPSRKLKVELPLDTLRNHFKTWRIQPPLPVDDIPFVDVFVKDQFSQDQDTAMMVVRLDSINFLSNPAKKVVANDTFNIIRPNDHLTWYRAKNLGPLKRFWVEYENQFESWTLPMDTLKYLLVPTQKDPHPKPDSLLGHYTAYKLRANRSLYFINGVKIQDQFDVEPESINGFTPVYFLTPAQKNNEPSFGPDTHYVAYEINPKRFAPQTRQTNDQFGAHIMQIDSSWLLLVPTKKTAFGVCNWRAGDANASGTYTLADAIAIVNYIFNKPGCTPMPLCWLSGMLCRGDWNGSGTVTLADAIRAVNYIFNKPGGPWDAVPIGECCL